MRSALRSLAPLAHVAGAALMLLSFVPAAAAQPFINGPLPQPLPLLPPSNWWNLDISGAPLDAGSSGYIAYIGTTTSLHPDFGGNLDPENPFNPEIYGFPYVSVDGNQPLVPVTFVDYPDESDAGAPGRPPGYPIPDQAKTQPHWIEGGWAGNDPSASGDRHLLLVDRDRHLLYELYNVAWSDARGRWEASSGAIFLLDTNNRRPEGWTSADAAGLAILPGLIRHDEATGTDPIRHAFRFTVQRTNGYVWPASHRAGSSPGALPMGARLRLKAGKDLSGYPAYIQKIFQAMKTYGLIVADNGSNMFVSGGYDTGWDNGELNPAFASLSAGDFEVVQLGWQTGGGGGDGFHSLSPCHLLDTRNRPGPGGGPALSPNVPRVVQASGRCGIPPSASALAVNAQVLARKGGTMQLFANGAVPGSGANVVFHSGRTRAGGLTLPLGGGAFVAVATTSRSVQVAIDVTGYYD